MREILFRGKRIDNGEWIKGFYCQVADESDGGARIKQTILVPTFLCQSGFKLLEVDSETVGQFTGLTDKNGRNIFEADICKFREWDNGEMCWIGYVHFEYCQFIISGGANKECPSNFHLVLSRFSPENIEVIGNIHDNPELLEMQ